MRFVTAIVVLLAMTPAISAAGTDTVGFPEGWRDWRHVKSMVLLPGHGLYDGLGGVHHIYANKLALDGYRKGKFPDGAIIVVDFFKEVVGENAVTEGNRKFIAVAHKNASKWKATGGWGWEAFAEGDKNKPLVGDKAAANCFQCHTAKKEHDYVFSVTRD